VADLHTLAGHGTSAGHRGTSFDNAFDKTRRAAPSSRAPGLSMRFGTAGQGTAPGDLRPDHSGDIIIRMQSSNGIDLNAVYQLLQEAVRRVGAIEARLDTHETKLNELITVVNGHSGRFDRLEAVCSEHSRKIDELNGGITELRKGVADYHDAAVGHGIWITEINARADSAACRGIS
jgi:hypothetical protein